MSENPISFTSLVAIQEQHRALLRERRDHPNDEGFLERAEQFIRAAADAGKILSDSVDRSELQVVLDYWVSVLYRTGRDVEDVELAEFDISVQPELADDDCPYIGLDGFNRQNADQFHGRKHVLDQLISRLQQSQVLVVVGEPGTGASSLIAAGLIPLLESGALSEVGDFSVMPIVTPGTDPLDSLQQVLVDEQEGPRFLIIDPVDAYFDTRLPRKDRKKFIKTLKNFVTQPPESNSNRLVLVSTIAARDAIIDGTFEVSEWFTDKFSNNSYRIPPMTFSDLKSVVIEPARRVGLHFDEGVVDDLITDVFGEPAALPLLQFSLIRLWRFRTRNRISRQTYDRLKGGRRALQMAAEDLWNSLDEDGQVQCKHILTSLVSLEELSPDGENQDSGPVKGACQSGVQSQHLPREVLRSGSSNTESFDFVLDSLVEEGLLKKIKVSDWDYEVKLAHNALFHWQRYGQWISESRQQLGYVKWLEEMAREFRERGQLLNERTLSHAQFCREQVGTAKLSQEITNLIKSSENALKWKKLRNLGVVVTLVTLLVIAFLYIWRSNILFEAVENIAGEIIGRVKVMESFYEPTNLALNRLASDNEGYLKVEEDLRVIRENLRIIILNAEVMGDFATQLQKFLGERNFKSVKFKPQVTNNWNRTLNVTTISRNENVQFWGVASRLSPKELAFGRSDGTLTILDKNNRSTGPIIVIEEKDSADSKIVNDVAYDSEGRYMAAGGVDGKVSVWDVKNLGKSAQPKWQCEVPGKVVSRVYSIKLGKINDKLIVAAGLDIDRAVVWDLDEQCKPNEARAPSFQFKAGGDVFGIDLHPHKPWLVLGSADQSIAIWSLKDSCKSVNESPPICKIRTLSGHQGAVFSVNFDPKSCSKSDAGNSTCTLLSSGADGKLHVWDVDTAKVIATPSVNTRLQLGMARYSPDGQWIAVASQTGSVFFWSTKHQDFSEPDFKAENLGGPVFGIAFEDSCGESCDFRLYAGTFAGRILKMELPKE